MKPYAIEAGFDNGDGTYSIHIRKLPLNTETHKDYRESEKLLYTTPRELSDEEIKDSVINCIGQTEYERTDDIWWKMLATDLVRKAIS